MPQGFLTKTRKAKIKIRLLLKRQCLPRKGKTGGLSSLSFRQ